jgi:hypothetical protein
VAMRGPPGAERKMASTPRATRDRGHRVSYRRRSAVIVRVGLPEQLLRLPEELALVHAIPDDPAFLAPFSCKSPIDRVPPRLSNTVSDSVTMTSRSMDQPSLSQSAQSRAAPARAACQRH